MTGRAKRGPRWDGQRVRWGTSARAAEQDQGQGGAWPHLRETPRKVWISNCFFRTSRTWPFSGPFFTFSRPIIYTRLGVRIKSLLMGCGDAGPELVAGALGVGSLAPGDRPEAERGPAGSSGPGRVGEFSHMKVQEWAYYIKQKVYWLERGVWDSEQVWSWVPRPVETVPVYRCIWAR